MRLVIDFMQDEAESNKDDDKVFNILKHKASIEDRAKNFQRRGPTFDTKEVEADFTANFPWFANLSSKNLEDVWKIFQSFIRKSQLCYWLRETWTCKIL